MLPSAITQKMLLSWGGESVYKQAAQLVQRGLVLRADMRGDLITGVIARESGSEIHTKLRVKPNGDIDSLCPCFTNQHSGQVCPHVVALGIAIMLRHADPLREQKYQEEQRRARRIESVAASAYVQRTPFGRPARLRLTLAPAWQQEFARGKVAVGLAFESGGVLTGPDGLPRGSAVALSPEDDNLLSVLEDICEGPPPASFTVAPPDFLNILSVSRHAPLAVADGKGGSLSVESEAVSVLLRVDVDPSDGELIVYPQIAEAREGSLPVFLVSGNRGYAVDGGRAWPMKNVLPSPYHEIYRTDEVIPRSNVINFLERDLPMLRKVSPVDMQTPPDLFVREPGKPSFRLEVRGSQASLAAVLRASYGDHEVLAGVPESGAAFSIPDPDDILRYFVRNAAAERAALQHLTAAGFGFDGTGYKLVDSRRVLNFLGSGYPALARLGWKVTFAGKVADWVESLPVALPVVRIAKADSGWFDVGFTFENSGGAPLPPAEVQRAINRGDSWLTYGGSTVLLDSGAVESMRSIFNDCRSRDGREPGHFRLPDVYAPFVQASLNALDGIDVEDPPDWRQRAAEQNRKGGTRLEPVPLGDLENVLRPYQKEGVYWLRFLEKSGLCGLLADEMGLGKTLQTLCWLSLPRLSPESRARPSLVVCPTSLVDNWAREAQTFVPRMKCLVLSGPARRERFPEIDKADLVITSYALIRRDQDEYARHSFAAAVLDEAQHIKNRNTQNAVAAKQINAASRLVLTGTPIENSVADLWSIMDFLMPGYLGEYDTFRDACELPIANGGPDGEAAQEKLRRKLHPFLLRRVKKDVAKDLPDKITKVEYVHLTDDQQRVYDALLAESRHKLGDMVKARGFEKSRFEILAMLLRLRQACCHLGLLPDLRNPAQFTEPSAKTDSLFELLDEALDGGHRILVFSQFVKMLTLLRNELEARKLPYCYLDGSTQDRLAECQRFNLDPGIPVFLISLKAGGTGLNLTGADMVVHFDPWWNPAVEDQATDRAHRIGQKRTVYSVKLIAEGTVEERVLAMQRRKQAVISATVGSTDADVMRSLSLDDIRGLLGL
jgi:hypothetical protein